MIVVIAVVIVIIIVVVIVVSACDQTIGTFASCPFIPILVPFS